MNKDEALKMAIEALEDNQHLIADNERHTYVMLYNSIIDKCKEALAQPAQEPVAWLYKRENNSGGWYVVTNYEKENDNGTRNIECYDIPLYTHPAPPCQECENLKHDLEGYMDANKALINREWQGLTSEEIRNLDLDNDVISVIFQTEKLLKEKNHAAG